MKKCRNIHAEDLFNLSPELREAWPFELCNCSGENEKVKVNTDFLDYHGDPVVADIRAKWDSLSQKEKDDHRRLWQELRKLTIEFMNSTPPLPKKE
jgi:hypothetical protein